jgi:subtilase family serine protease
VTAVNENVAGVVSISLGACESAYTGSDYLTAFENELAIAALAKQGVYVASGDSGAYACRPGAPLAVSYPASSEYVTAVGGTTLRLNSNSSYNSESAWGARSGDCNQPCGSGGGYSSVIAEPSWQKGVTLIDARNMRGVPDVAYNADPATGDKVFYNRRWWTGYGGTSIGAPQWAGFASLTNQAIGRRPARAGRSARQPTRLVRIRCRISCPSSLR